MTLDKPIANELQVLYGDNILESETVALIERRTTTDTSCRKELKKVCVFLIIPCILFSLFALIMACVYFAVVDEDIECYKISQYVTICCEYGVIEINGNPRCRDSPYEG